MVTENKPLENVKYNQQYRPKDGETENFSKGEAQMTFHHLVFSIRLCKSIQKLQKEKLLIYVQHLFWSLHFLNLGILYLDTFIAIISQFI